MGTPDHGRWWSSWATERRELHHALRILLEDDHNLPPLHPLPKSILPPGTNIIDLCEEPLTRASLAEGMAYAFSAGNALDAWFRASAYLFPCPECLEVLDNPRLRDVHIRLCHREYPTEPWAWENLLQQIPYTPGDPENE